MKPVLSLARTKPYARIIPEILAHVEKKSGLSVQKLSKLLPKQILKYTKFVPSSAFLVDENVAGDFAKLIKSENPDVNCPVLELNPGIGLLTSQLVKTVGFKCVTCFEDNLKLREHLEQLNVTVIDGSTDNLPRLHHLDKHDGGERVNLILSKIKTAAATTEVTEVKKGDHDQLYLIGAISQIGIINFLLRSFVTHRVFFDDDLPWSRVTLFLALGAKPYTICTATPESGMVAYRPTSVFFHTLFKFKELGTIDRKAFLPWELKDTEVRKGPRTRKLKLTDEARDVFNVLKVEINEDAVKKIGKENLFVYWYFVRHHLHARKNRIIPELENWVPGCGVRLIKKQGFNIYSQVGALTPEQVFNLYLEFVSWPEFPSSSFLTAMEKYQTRVELNEEEEGVGNINFDSKRT